MQLPALFRPPAPIPASHRRNFLHLYFDVAWVGVLTGSLLAFAPVYLTRIGASAGQLGWYTAIPALVALALSLPAGWWLRDRQTDRAVFWSALIFRVFYLIWLPLPLLVPAPRQISAVLLITWVMSGPSVVLAISFNALFADVVPSEWRSYVIGIRHGILALTSIAVSLISGAILEHAPFPLSYQVVFAIGAIGGAMSTVHLWFIRDGAKQPRRDPSGLAWRDFAQPGLIAAFREARPAAALRYMARRPHLRLPRTEVLTGHYGRVMALVCFFFLALYAANPLYNPYWVDELHYGDQLLSQGTALFYLCQLLGASQLSRVTRYLGDQKALAAGAFLLSSYPGLTALSASPYAFLAASALAGAAWGIAGGALLAYLLGAVPEGQRPRYLAWYTLLTNLATLAGALLGPLLATFIGLAPALGAAGLLRLASGLFFWWWGGGDSDRGPP